jgi:hypothetical protein
MALRSSPCDVNRLRRLYDQMSRKLIGGKVTRRRNSEDDLYDVDDDVPDDDEEDLAPGPYFAKFQKKFAGELEKLCGKDGSQIVQLAKVILPQTRSVLCGFSEMSLHQVLSINACVACVPSEASILFVFLSYPAVCFQSGPGSKTAKEFTANAQKLGDVIQQLLLQRIAAKHVERI